MSIPLVREISGAPRPEELFARLSEEPWTVWLDTSLTGQSSGRYSFLAVDPFRVLRGRDGNAEWIEPGGIRPARRAPLRELQDAMGRYRLSNVAGLPPFCGGAAGMFGYELASDLESIPPAEYRDLATPDLEIGFYDLVVGWDREEDRCWISSTGSADGDELAGDLAARRLRQANEWLNGGPTPAEYRLPGGSGLSSRPTAAPPTHPVPSHPGLRSTFSPEAYQEAVRQAIEWIRAGDVYQVNLSQRFEINSGESPAHLYLRLRDASPAPFGAFFAGDQFSVLSTSPERFLHVSLTGNVQTRPIKGTRPRAEDPTEDRALAESLQASVKDRAENLMIVDLLRNDLSRVCRPDSVRASELFRIESYRTVHHLVSTVEGRLKMGLDTSDLLGATFPSGSVTGAPKIRAMQLISEIEPVARGPYCGAVGYLGFGGDMDTSVSIRIAIATEGRVIFHAGGAVVADSDPAAEYAETLDKARALLSAIPAGLR
ncbi:MAG: aminodeoxychorismate synthase component I [Gemmatimonadetes bacterium]|nr:aminodeoxychorismate synthase component I [Gemmatimonadota bacterium]